jgi:hypothetical protein
MAIEPTYSERYVAFLDILGFSEIVRGSTASQDKVAELVRTLENIAAAKQEFGGDIGIEPDDFNAQSFSDCIVLSENASARGLFHLLASVTVLSFNLLSKGIFTRGGIAKGQLHHSDKVVFGPAMLDAYNLESTIAVYPRILVDRATHTDYKSPGYAAVGGSYSKMPTLRPGDDGPPFVDILIQLRPPPMIDIEDIHPVRESIQTALNNSIYVPRHFQKVRWLAIYFNELALELGAAQVKFPST